MRKLWGLSLAGVLAVCSLGFAQQVQPTQPGVRPGANAPGGRPNVGRPGVPQNQPVQNQQQHQMGDQQIAHMIVGGNRNEVEISKFAMDRLQSSEAKEIATKMIKDHTEAMQKFSKFAGASAQLRTGDQGEDRNRGTGRNEESRREGDESDRPAAAAATKPATAAPNAGGRNVQAGVAVQNQAAGQPHVALRPVASGVNWQAIHQEICDQGLEDCKKELSRYEGNEFDKAYLGHQVAAHMMMATKLKVLKKHASSQLAAEIDNALETTESHLKHIRSTMDEKKEEKSDSKKRS